MKKNKSQEIIRYNFLNEWLETANKEEIINKLIENDERCKLINELEYQNDKLCEMVTILVNKLEELNRIIEKMENPKNEEN